LLIYALLIKSGYESFELDVDNLEWLWRSWKGKAYRLMTIHLGWFKSVYHKLILWLNISNLNDLTHRFFKNLTDNSELDQTNMKISGWFWIVLYIS